MWNFETVCTLAIRKLGEFPLEPVEKLELCRCFNIDRNWAREAHQALCSRNTPLSLDEMVKVGLEYAVPIIHAREQRFRSALRQTDVYRAYANLY